jgi:hypothetical protein
MIQATINTYKNGGVTATKINVFVNQFTTFFGSDGPSSGDS